MARPTTVTSKTEKPGTRWNAVWREYRKAASKLESSAEALIPDQPWSEIRGIGNIIRHEYDSVDPLIIWNIVSRELNNLRTAVGAALEKLQRQSPNQS